MKDRFGFRARVWLVALSAALGLAAVCVLPPLRQWQEYHRFADQAPFLGIPNCLNVISNAAFVIVGLIGLGFLARKREANKPGGFVETSERWAYAVFFLGVTLTGFGSAYYHWNPCDSTLVWDRLPLTVAFMSVLAATITERLNVKLGRLLLVPLVVAGAASVFYWQRTGNLWPYAAAQYYSVLLIVVMIGLFPPRYGRTADWLWVVGVYALAKVAEALDQPIMSATKVVSGHTLKHLTAAVAVFWLLRMLAKRIPERQDRSGDRQESHRSSCKTTTRFTSPEPQLPSLGLHALDLA
jgi:hypothetical protein